MNDWTPCEPYTPGNTIIVQQEKTGLMYKIRRFFTGNREYEHVERKCISVKKGPDASIPPDKSPHWLLIAALLMLSGCASMDEADRMFYIQHSIDVAQTYQVSKSPCHYEGDPVTSRLIGDNPSAEGVLIWGAATALTYYVVKDRLPKWTKHVNVSYRAYTINSNQDKGLSVGSHSCQGGYMYEN